MSKYVGIGREEGRKRGLREGHAESLLHILDAKGLAVSEALRQRILGCQDMDTLDGWIRKAALATKLGAIFDTEWAASSHQVLAVLAVTFSSKIASVHGCLAGNRIMVSRIAAHD